MRIICVCVFLSLAFGCTGEEPMDCVREVRCVEVCGGPETSAGCGPCPAGRIDVDECVGDSGPPPIEEDGGGMCAPLGDGCDARPCCSGVCCVVVPEGGAGGYTCYPSEPASSDGCI